MKSGIVKHLFKSFLYDILDIDDTGSYGERLTEEELRISMLFSKIHGEIVRNVYLPKENGETSEIDVLFITRKGILVIESKNYSGWIFGGEKDYYWTVCLPNKKRFKFYNPIMQNKGHIKWLKNYIGEKIPMFSVIAFSERCELKDVKVEDKDIVVINRDEMNYTIRCFWDDNKDIISDEEVMELYNKLKVLTNVDEATRIKHINDIDKKVSKNLKICPICNRELIVRTAKRGQHVGKKFYGCSGYPACKYTKDIDD